MMPPMRKHLFIFCGVAIAACGGSYPEPREAATATEAAVRSAQEVGADKDPSATLHLKYAKDQSDEAKKHVADGDNHRAEMVLARAKSDAELALMMAKAHNHTVEAEKAEAEVAEKRKKLGK